jgi:tartronate-semialdehyde synthase
MEDEGVEYTFGILGAAILPLFKALEGSENIKTLAVRHEEGGTHAADGYARVTGKVGISIGTSGPAGTNMITGLYTAIADSILIICIAGQAPTRLLTPGGRSNLPRLEHPQRQRGDSGYKRG